MCFTLSDSFAEDKVQRTGVLGVQMEPCGLVGRASPHDFNGLGERGRSSYVVAYLHDISDGDEYTCSISCIRPMWMP